MTTDRTDRSPPQTVEVPVEPCKCNCGYRCGGPGVCKLGVIECLQTEGHFVRDCGHDFTGWKEGRLNGGGAYGTTVCSKCGMTSMRHDSMVGP